MLVIVSLSSIIFGIWGAFFTSISIVESAPIAIGSFRTRQHQLQGTVTLLSESVIQITVGTLSMLSTVLYKKIRIQRRVHLTSFLR
jgi:hypothetical protein